MDRSCLGDQVPRRRRGRLETEVTRLIRVIKIFVETAKGSRFFAEVELILEGIANARNVMRSTCQQVSVALVTKADRTIRFESELDEASEHHGKLSVEYRRQGKEVKFLREQRDVRSSRTVATQASRPSPPAVRAQAMQMSLRSVSASVAIQAGVPGRDVPSGCPVVATAGKAVQTERPEALPQNASKGEPDHAMLAAVGTLVEAKLASFRENLLREVSLSFRANESRVIPSSGQGRVVEGACCLFLGQVARSAGLGRRKLGSSDGATCSARRRYYGRRLCLPVTFLLSPATGAGGPRGWCREPYWEPTSRFSASCVGGRPAELEAVYPWPCTAKGSLSRYWDGK